MLRLISRDATHTADDYLLVGEHGEAMQLNSGFSKLSANRLGRDFIVGDLHGQLNLLMQGLRLCAFDEATDRLIAVGDLIDRGNGSEALLRWVEEKPWFYSVLGNHEAMMLEARQSGPMRNIWMANGGGWAVKLTRRRLEALRQIALRMPMAIELELTDGRRVGIVHAEIPHGLSWQEMKRQIETGSEAYDQDNSVPTCLLWGRKRISSYLRLQASRANHSEHVTTQSFLPVAGIDQIFSGHTIINGMAPLTITNMTYIDSGAFDRSGYLTLVEPLTGGCWRVEHDDNSPALVA